MEYVSVLTLRIPGHAKLTVQDIVDVSGEEASPGKAVFDHMIGRAVDAHGQQWANADVVSFTAEPCIITV